ncbi:hypothetical protein VUR80DRAFT_7055 [Thermomyces stellatus]
MFRHRKYQISLVQTNAPLRNRKDQLGRPSGHPRPDTPLSPQTRARNGDSIDPPGRSQNAGCRVRGRQEGLPGQGSQFHGTPQASREIISRFVREIGRSPPRQSISAPGVKNWLRTRPRARLLQAPSQAENGRPKRRPLKKGNRITRVVTDKIFAAHRWKSYKEAPSGAPANCDGRAAGEKYDRSHSRGRGKTSH